MRNLIDIVDIKDLMEAIEDNDLDAEHESEINLRHAREKHVETLVHYAFEKINLAVNYNNYSIMYDEPSREVEVKLEGDFDGVALDKLIRLKETGLSKSYMINTSDGDIWVKFVLDKALDLQKSQPKPMMLMLHSKY